jgi:UDP-N-acetylmuramoylalanine--D-glutamate ligase
LRVPGGHNIENAAVAMGTCTALGCGLGEERVARALESFPGLPHRLQLVGEDGTGDAVRYYNDSKSTTPEAAVRAVEAISAMPGYSRSNVHLIAGGYDKGSDLSAIGAMANELGGLYTIGATGPAIGAVATDGKVFECGTLARAVERAGGRMKPGDCLLLSPGCASWDQYNNFEERGEEFIRLVRAGNLA